MEVGSIAITGDNCRLLVTLKGYCKWRVFIGVHNVYNTSLGDCGNVTINPIHVCFL